MNIELKCNCGAVTGNMDAKTGTRVICYCTDCQKFAEYLGHDDIVDDCGGTDIFQVTPSQVTITQGKEHLRCVRLSSKGLIRWHTGCCNTPIGNTVMASLPFIGVIHSFMILNGDSLGSVRYRICAKSAKKPPQEKTFAGFPLRMFLFAWWRISLAKILGSGWPSAFFYRDGRPVSEPKILD